MNAVNFPVQRDAASLQSEAREKALGLRELRYFLSVAQTGNLGRAAQALNVSQPAISLQLRKLEDGVGTPLLLRHGRGVTLTAAGACLRDRLLTVLQILSAPLADGGIGSAPGTLSFAVPAEIGAPLVTPLARTFRARWPDVTLDVREGSGTEIEEWLLHRHVDLAILQDPPALPELEITPMLSEELGLVAPVQSHLARGTRPVGLRELAGELLILPGAEHALRRRLDHAAQRHGVRLRPILQVNSVALIKMMVRGGLGCTILPVTAVQDEVARGALAFRPVEQPVLTCVRAIAFHRAAANTLVTPFAAMLRDAMAGLAESGAWPGAELLKPSRMPEPHERVTMPAAWQPVEEVAAQ